MAAKYLMPLSLMLAMIGLAWLVFGPRARRQRQRRRSAQDIARALRGELP